MSTPKFSRLDPAQRREQILDAASALFAKRAYDEVSIEASALWGRRRRPNSSAQPSLPEPPDDPYLTQGTGVLRPSISPADEPRCRFAGYPGPRVRPGVGDTGERDKASSGACGGLSGAP